MTDTNLEPVPVPTGEAPAYPWTARLKPYAKFAVAMVGVVAGALVQAVPDSPSVARWSAFAVSIATAVAVYLTPNKAPDGI